MFKNVFVKFDWAETAELFVRLTFKFFPSMIFCGEAAKKTSIDGLKW